METVNVHEAKTHLSRLLERAAKGETITIAKAGKPIAKLVPLDEAPKKVVQRIGFMAGEGVVPDDIKTPFKDEIEEMFYGKP
ncbi:type II toxin-antitoxin system Phd/YefM family antitoxin [Brevundimonas sp.]|jgi:prevent-host-death family protein|uniref:type II toxin-antitoxin system Phd/YefM family antitoxin n=1 Tax=Brevundimonas sp. TaxID=1871086 RepID=UPI001797CFDB|nr:type II toxin-antitoxin system Phd/YefM family antitoxin [Brevundimonas sp.]MBA4807612.1 type II toxin-antitoxin system Phd/YefM family antitoxin [Brevundimonas sp.]